MSDSKTMTKKLADEWITMRRNNFMGDEIELKKSLTRLLERNTKDFCSKYVEEFNVEYYQLKDSQRKEE